MINYAQIIMVIIATPLTIYWILICNRGSAEYGGIIDSIAPEEFKYPELFGVGFLLMKKLGIDGRSKSARKKVKELAEVYGKKYAQYYFHIMTAAKLTYGYTILTLGCLLAALANEIYALVLGIALAALMVWYTEELFKDKLVERRDEIISDFPQILSKLTLLVNSGMIMREAWTRVAQGGTRIIYREMQVLTQEQDNGISDLEAYKNFADRCGNKEIRRFSSMMIQNLQKGNAELAYFLREMSEEMWEAKMHMLRRKGQAASSKLLLPIVIIFIGILAMIIIPAFSEMSF